MLLIREMIIANGEGLEFSIHLVEWWDWVGNFYGIEIADS
jgi:hypothetical protein